MSFDWNKFLDLAQELLEQAKSLDVALFEDKEAKFRTAVSRAYYSAYRQAKNYLVENGEYYPSNAQKDNDHLYVRDSFWDVANPTRNEIARDLKRLRADRNKCDYDDEIDMLLQNLEKLPSLILLLLVE
jgi:uncharacterized protein (UPF0332 family)